MQSTLNKIEKKINTSLLPKYKNVKIESCSIGDKIILIFTISSKDKFTFKYKNGLTCSYKQELIEFKKFKKYINKLDLGRVEEEKKFGQQINFIKKELKKYLY